MNIFTKRNALVGYLVLNAGRRARGRMLRRNRKRGALRLATFVVLGLISVGVLAVVAAVVFRRQREPQHLEGYAVAEEAEGEIVGEYVTMSPEPNPAT